MSKGFVMTMKETFSKSGQTAMEFLGEMKKLTQEDKAWYHAELMKSGIECNAPEAPTA